MILVYFYVLLKERCAMASFINKRKTHHIHSSNLQVSYCKYFISSAHVVLNSLNNDPCLYISNLITYVIIIIDYFIFYIILIINTLGGIISNISATIISFILIKTKYLIHFQHLELNLILVKIKLSICTFAKNIHEGS